MAGIEIIEIQDCTVEELNEHKITDPYITKYEFTRLIAYRDIQLRGGDSPRVKVDKECNTLEIARKEVYERTIPLIIQRNLPDGRIEYWKISDMYIF